MTSSKAESTRCLIQVSPEPIKELGDVPSISQLAKTDAQRRLVRLTTTVPYQYARSFLVGPKVSKERVAEIRKAFNDTMTDPAFLAEAKKGRLKISPIKGTALQSYVREFLEMPADEKKKVLGVVAGK